MNNVKIFYERKELLKIVKDSIENRYMFSVSNNEGDLRIKLNNDLDSELGKDNKRIILDIIENEIKELEPKMRECVIRKLTEFMEYNKKRIVEDLGLIGGE